MKYSEKLRQFIGREGRMYSDATLPVIYYPPEGPWSYVDVIVAVEEDFVEIKRTYSDDLPGISYFFPLGLIQISLKH